MSGALLILSCMKTLYSESDDPWYITDKKEEASSKSASRKELMDPINEMKHYLGAKRKCSKGAPTPPYSQVQIILTFRVWT